MKMQVNWDLKDSQEQLEKAAPSQLPRTPKSSISTMALAGRTVNHAVNFTVV